MAMRTLNGDGPIPVATLKQALQSLYSELCAVFAGREETMTSHFLNVELPGIVFDVAVGAGWIHINPDIEESRRAPRFHGDVLVSFGELTVERSFADQFMELLRDEIEFHEGSSETTTAERMNALPPFTGIEERNALLEQYLAQCVFRRR